MIPDALDASLVLVRHGESELIVERRFQGRLETPLSERGRHQAELVAGRLARPHARPALPLPDGAPIEVVHSPLSRAAQTARAIQAALADGHGGNVESGPLARADARFTEIGQGEWEGRLATEVAASDGDRLAGWRRRPTETWAPGGERLADVRERVTLGLSELLANLASAGSPGSIDAPQVGGYEVGRASHPWAILVGHDGVFKVTLLTLFDLPLERFWMWSSDLCGISIIEFRAGRPVARALNLTEHLAPLQDDAAVEASERRQRTGAL